jgi:hypothetical protein
MGDSRTGVAHAPGRRRSLSFALWALVGLVITVTVGLLVRGGDPRPQDRERPTAVSPGPSPEPAPVVRDRPQTEVVPPTEVERPKKTARVWRSGRRSSPPPPKLESSPSTAKPGGTGPVTFSKLMETNEPLASAFSDFAHAKGRSDRAALVKRCALGLAKRKPEESQGNKVEGAVAITLRVSGGKARVTDIKALRGGDEEFAQCYQETATSLHGEFEVAGSPDTTVDLEWDYRFGWY